MQTMLWARKKRAMFQVGKKIRVTTLVATLIFLAMTTC